MTDGDAPDGPPNEVPADDHPRSDDSPSTDGVADRDGDAASQPATPDAGAGRTDGADLGAADEGDPDGAGDPWDLERAWDEHRPYVYWAAGLFVAATVLGVALGAAGVDLLELVGVDDLEDLLGDDVEFTVAFIVQNNTQAYLVMVAGAITVGSLTALVLVVNGVLVGWVVADAAAAEGIGLTLALILPHGILELPALFVGAGIGFRLVHVGLAYLRGTRGRLLRRDELARTLLLLAVGWVVLAVAAVVEVHVTPAIAEALFGFEGGSSLE